MGRQLALLIATYQYDDAGLRQLTAPAHDAEALAAVLGDAAIAGFEVTTLINEPHHRVGQAIGEFYRDRRRDDLTLLYFTGHGLKDDDGRLYLAMTDTLRDNLLFTGLSADQVDRAMEGCLSRRKVLILDCCYSGAFPAGQLTKADTGVHALERFQGRGRTVLTASDATQYSFEGDQLHGHAAQSVFTRYLVAGLRDGSADLDGDGDITLDELYSYVHDRVVEERPQQRPKKQDNVEGRTVIARNINWTLPTYLRNALASPIATDRRAALDGLSHLYRIGNDIVRGHVQEQIHRLAHDDSKLVSAAATTLLQSGQPQPPKPAEFPVAPQTPAQRPSDPPSTSGSAPDLEADEPVAATSEHGPLPGAPPPQSDEQAESSPVPSGSRIRARWRRRPRKLVLWGLLAAILLTAATTLTVIIIRPRTNTTDTPMLGEPIRTKQGLVTVTLAQHDGKPVIVSGGGPALQVWDLASHQPVGQPIILGEDDNTPDFEMLSVAVGQVDGKSVIVSLSYEPGSRPGSLRTGVRVWDLATHQPMGEPIQSSSDGPIDTFYSLVVGQLDGKPVVITGGGDKAVRIWDLTTHQPIGQPLISPAYENGAMHLGQLDGKPVLLTGGGDKAVRIWDLTTHQPIGKALDGHTDYVTSIALGQLDGKTVVISSSLDLTIRVWDPTTQRALGSPLVGHTDGVQSVAVGQLDGKPVVFSGSRDGTVRVWDLATHQPIGQPLTGPGGTHFNSVAVGQLDGKPVIVAGSDSIIRVWDLAAVARR